MLRRLRHILAIAIPVTLIAVLLAVLLCYLNRWDELVIVTLIPMWAWASAGILLSVLSWATLKSRLSVLTFALWLVAGVAFSDETAGLLREFRSAVSGNRSATAEEPAQPERLRVISMNGEDGKAATSVDLKKLAPGIVLLQNAPDRAELIDLTSELFGPDGTFIRSEQCAILARGRLTVVFTEPATGSLSARLERPGGEMIDVINLHLPRAAPRFDIWSSECRQLLIERRKENRRTLRRILETLDQAGQDHRVVGGSFGAPPSDDIFRLLRNAGLTDSFRQAGYGWGNTFPGSVPVLRTDQIWASPPYRPERSETFFTAASDHRYVISDFRRKKKSKKEPEGKLASTTLSAATVAR